MSTVRNNSGGQPAEQMAEAANRGQDVRFRHDVVIQMPFKLPKVFRTRAGSWKAIEALDTATSLFFDHRDPAMVKLFSESKRKT